MSDTTVSGYPTYKCEVCGMETSVLPATDHWDGGAFVEHFHTTDGLTPKAIEILAEAGFTPEQWSKANYGDGTWTGDRCGCADSRCIGFHHMDEDNCGCLPVWIEDALAGRS